MTKAWLAGVAAFAMMTGVALAQSSSTTTTTVVPGVGEYSSHRSERTIDSYGGQTDRSTTYSTGNGGTERRDTTTRSSGPYVPYAPYGDSTTTHSTTTTIR